MLSRTRTVLVSGLLALVGCGPAITVDDGTSTGTETGTDPDTPPAACENRIVHDEVADDVVDRTGTLEFDAAGRLIRYTEATQAGEVWRVDRTFEDGRLVQQIETKAVGVIERTVAIDYDEEGRVASISVDGVGAAAQVIRRHHDAEGRLSEEEIDDGADGTVDQIRQYHYEEGEPFVFEITNDYDGDGVAESVNRMYFKQGRWLVAIDGLHNGVLEATTSFTYDGEGPETLSRIELDLPADGVPEFITHVQHDQGRISHLDYDDEGDGVIDETADLTYDGAGRIVKNAFTAPNPTYFAGVFAFDWQEGGPLRMEQRDAAGQEVYRTWQFDDACPVDRPFFVRRSPVGDWLQWTNPLGYELDWEKYLPAYEDADPFYW